jgi:hypothetical protein
MVDSGPPQRAHSRDLMTVLGFRASLGNPSAGSRAVSLPGSCAATNSCHDFHGNAIIGNLTQACS